MKSKTEAAFIYSLSDPETGEVRYVGKAFDVKRRLSCHLTDKRPSHKVNWIASLKKRSLKPTLNVLEAFTGVPDEVWQKAERRWIAAFRNEGFRLVNLSSGGTEGSRHSPETIAKMRAVHKGKVIGQEQRAKARAQNLGKRQSPELVRKRIAPLIGRKRSPEVCAKLSAANKGKSIPPETRARISAALKGRKAGPFTEEHVANMRKVQKGKRPSVECWEKSLLFSVGRRHTPEEIAKQVAAQTGRECSPPTRAKISAKAKERAQQKRKEG